MQTSTCCCSAGLLLLEAASHSKGWPRAKQQRFWASLWDLLLHLISRRLRESPELLQQQKWGGLGTPEESMKQLRGGPQVQQQQRWRQQLPLLPLKEMGCCSSLNPAATKSSSSSSSKANPIQRRFELRFLTL